MNSKIEGLLSSTSADDIACYVINEEDGGKERGAIVLSLREATKPSNPDDEKRTSFRGCVEEVVTPIDFDTVAPLEHPGGMGEELLDVRRMEGTKFGASISLCGGREACGWASVVDDLTEDVPWTVKNAYGADINWLVSAMPKEGCHLRHTI